MMKRNADCIKILNQYNIEKPEVEDEEEEEDDEEYSFGPKKPQQEEDTLTSKTLNIGYYYLTTVNWKWNCFCQQDVC